MKSTFCQTLKPTLLPVGVYVLKAALLQRVPLTVVDVTVALVAPELAGGVYNLRTQSVGRLHISCCSETHVKHVVYIGVVKTSRVMFLELRMST